MEKLYLANMARFNTNRQDLEQPVGTSVSCLPTFLMLFFPKVWLKATDAAAIEDVDVEGLTETQRSALPCARKVFTGSVDFSVNTVALEPENSRDHASTGYVRSLAICFTANLPLCSAKSLDQLLDEKLPSKAPYQMPLWDAAPRTAESPFMGIPKIAVCGRSNVGKSSLMNAVIGGSLGVFQTSKTPGRTRLAEYACVSNKLALVDLPGYGYAKVSKKLQKDMSARLTNFFEKDPPKRVFVLIDGRHGVMENDKQFMERLTDASIPFQIVVTKADRVSPRGLKAVIADARFAVARESVAFPSVLVTSATRKIGIRALQAEIVIACGLVAAE
jgi:GTP-binding protein